MEFMKLGKTGPGQKKQKKWCGRIFFCFVCFNNFITWFLWELFFKLWNFKFFFPPNFFNSVCFWLITSYNSEIISDLVNSKKSWWKFFFIINKINDGIEFKKKQKKSLQQHTRILYILQCRICTVFFYGMGCINLCL